MFFQHIVENSVEKLLPKKFSTHFQQVFNSFNIVFNSIFYSNIVKNLKNSQVFNTFNFSTFNSLLKTFQKLQRS